MATTREIDTAIITRLASDAELTALMPGGVHWDLATLGATRYVVVSQLASETHYVLPNVILWERLMYLVKVVAKGATVTEVVEQAYDRIFALLQNQEAALDLATYTARMLRMVERVRISENNEQTDQRWQHEGAHYEVLAVPEAVPGLARRAAIIDAAEARGDRWEKET